MVCGTTVGDQGFNASMGSRLRASKSEATEDRASGLQRGDEIPVLA